MSAVRILLLAAILAKGGSHGGSSVSHSSHASSSGSRTVHVSGYTRKDGTYVHAYDRSAPGARIVGGSGFATSFSDDPPLNYRSTARTQARTSARTGSIVEVPPSIPAPLSAPEYRTWHDITGKFTVEAAYAGMVDYQVNLHKPDQATIRVPLEKLSVEDRNYVLGAPLP
jgi:hypothetical protein